MLKLESSPFVLLGFGGGSVLAGASCCVGSATAAFGMALALATGTTLGCAAGAGMGGTITSPVVVERSGAAQTRHLHAVGLLCPTLHFVQNEAIGVAWGGGGRVAGAAFAAR